LHHTKTQLPYGLPRKEGRLGHQPQTHAPTWHFHLEPLCVFLGRNTLPSDKGEKLHFWVQAQLAQTQFYEVDILYFLQFDLVDCEMVYGAFHQVPCVFQKWVCNQVMDIAPHNSNQAMGNQTMSPLPQLWTCSGDLITHPPLPPKRWPKGHQSSMAGTTNIG
jgi:hypothetical protein